MAINSMTVTEVPESERSAFCKPHFRKTYVFLIVGILLICVGLAAYYIVNNVNKSNATSRGDDGKDGALVPPDTEEKLPPSPSHFHVFKKAAVCTDGPPCSVIGRDILKKNGSAVDATIAAMFCNGIVNMQSMGLGGGFLMTIYTRATRSSVTLNAREVAPQKATEDMFKANISAALKGPLAIGVPGELRGYWMAHQRFGVLPWKDLVEPSLELCRTGYNMSKALWESVTAAKIIKDNPHFQEMFYDPGSDNPKKGNSLVIPSKALCKTLEIIAQKGGDELYNGTLSVQLAEDLKEAGSIITKDDLESYRAQWQEPIKLSLPNEGTFYSIRPPGGGALLGFILQILNGYHFNQNSINGLNNTVTTYHRITEAFKYAFAMRTRLGDGDFVNLEQLLQNVTSPEYANKIRLSINDGMTYKDPAHYGAEFYTQSDHGTAHISVLAPNGDAVSVTSTINHYFGSEVVARRTGIIMNNVMDDFSSPGFSNQFGVPASSTNFIQPGKRAMSSMSPSIIVDEAGDVRMVIGASGGTKITTAVALVIMRNLWFKQSIKEAVDAPRIHHQLYPMEISYEYGNLKQEIEGLQKLGHKTRRYKDRGSIICALFRNETAIYANADYRKGGDVFGLD